MLHGPEPSHRSCEMGLLTRTPLRGHCTGQTGSCVERPSETGGRYRDGCSGLFQSPRAGVSLLGGWHLRQGTTQTLRGGVFGTGGWCVRCRPAPQSCGLLPPFVRLARLAPSRPSLTWRVWGRVSVRAQGDWPFSLSLSRHLSIIFTVRLSPSLQRVGCALSCVPQ